MSWSSCSVALACSLSPHILRTLGNKVGAQTILLVIKNHSQTEKKEIIPSVSEKRGSIMSFYFKLRANNRNMVGRVDWDRIMITTFIHYLLFGSCLVARFFFCCSLGSGNLLQLTTSGTVGSYNGELSRCDHGCNIYQIL